MNNKFEVYRVCLVFYLFSTVSSGGPVAFRIYCSDRVLLMNETSQC